VGGAHRLLLQDAPAAIGRSVSVSAATETDDAAAAAVPKVAASITPVVLEPRLPKLRRDKADREANASPVALAFISWLQQSLASRALKYNETGAAVHFVAHGMALVSPLIFKMYAATQVPETQIGEHALLVQREVVKAGWNVLGPNNTNILSYQVTGRGGVKAGHLAAVVLSEPGRFVQPVPPSNPALSLI
jgi:hypothetical protein